MLNNSRILIIPCWLYWQIWWRIIHYWAPLTSICWLSSNLRFWISFILVHNFDFGIFMKRYFINQDKDIKSRSLNNLSIKIEVRSMTDYSSYKSLAIRALPWCGKFSNGLIISSFTAKPISMAELSKTIRKFGDKLQSSLKVAQFCLWAWVFLVNWDAW